MLAAQLPAAGVVVTGAGSGIGAALARRFAAEGARVVINDIDAAAATAVAAQTGGFAVPGDAASEHGVAELVSRARAELGEIDLYCANAGVAYGGGEDASELDWERSWQVNVMAHVRAARLLVGPWLDRGSGHLIATVSAAGLLTMLGAAPYSVTKHGALAFAEWMSATYRHRGITVQALCPQGVRTPMLEATGDVGKLILGASAIEPDQVANTVVEALSDDRFLILPHPEVAQMYGGRAAETDRWLRGINKIQRRTDTIT
ncbi:MAG TPA: SDR family oxidoreductase [Streptosporangiaceae bacterium]|nr:SDR family oxidoreductase [Streptosporangiaceae bacterium]